jgi:tRNA/rRNA methyltransferase
VLLVGYEWYTARTEPRPELLHTGHSRRANKEELLRFFGHFEEALVISGFLRDPQKRPSLFRNLRNLFQRAQCTEQELRTLHGVITAFIGPRKRPNAAANTEAAPLLPLRPRGRRGSG